MSVFDGLFALVWIGSIALDYLKLKNKKLKDINKGLYISVNAVTLALFIAHVANVRVTMPTQWLSRSVAPWVKSMLGGFFNA